MATLPRTTAAVRTTDAAGFCVTPAGPVVFATVNGWSLKGGLFASLYGSSNTPSGLAISFAWRAANVEAPIGAGHWSTEISEP